jgi:GWxTD domain-containing protein
MSPFTRFNWLLVGIGTLAILGTQILPARSQDQRPPRSPHNRPLNSGDHLPYQKWLDEDVVYIITEQERADFAKLTTDEQRDKFIEDFWERRNPNPGSAENPFKEEHYRRLAYVNQHFAAGIPGWKTDRGRIYIIYGPPDQREQHPGSADPSTSATSPLRQRYPSDIWRYHLINGIGRDVFFVFVDKCLCGQYQLQNDPTKKRPPSMKEKENLVPVKTHLALPYRERMTEDVFVALTVQERVDFEKYCDSLTFNLNCILNRPPK